MTPFFNNLKNLEFFFNKGRKEKEKRDNRRNKRTEGIEVATLKIVK